MNRLLVTALLTLCFFPSWSLALDITHIRACYGPLGPKRDDIKCLPGDIFFMAYDIESLTLDKGGKASISTKFEFLNPKQEVIFEKTTPKDVFPQLGGARIPGDVHVFIGAKQPPGKYTIRVTITDKLANKAKAFSQVVDVQEPAFGFVGGMSRGIGLAGDPTGHVASFALVNLALDAKKQPNAVVTIRILEGTKEVAPATEIAFPAQLPEDNMDLEKANFVPITFPMFLNRPGNYTIDVQASDKISKKTAKLSFPLRVIDVGDAAGK